MRILRAKTPYNVASKAAATLQRFAPSSVCRSSGVARRVSSRRLALRRVVCRRVASRRVAP
eukprot:5468836-Lingulodinium_polyedra.AAC.1